jgi:hypothetical protein
MDQYEMSVLYDQRPVSVFVLDGLGPMGDATLGREALSATHRRREQGVRFAHRIVRTAKE